MDRKKLIKVFGDYPKIRVLDFLISNPDTDYSQADIIKYSNNTFNTVRLFWPSMIKDNLVVNTRRIGKSEMYIINKENPVIKKLIQIDRIQNGLDE